MSFHSAIVFACSGNTRFQMSKSLAGEIQIELAGSQSNIESFVSCASKCRSKRADSVCYPLEMLVKPAVETS